jgi:hypothetical protein
VRPDRLGSGRNNETYLDMDPLYLARQRMKDRMVAPDPMLIRSNLEVIGALINTGKPLTLYDFSHRNIEVRERFFRRVDGPYTFDEVVKMTDERNVRSRGGEETDAFLVFSPWPGEINLWHGNLTTLRALESIDYYHYHIHPVNLENLLYEYAMRGNSERVKTVLQLGADLTAVGGTGMPFITTARESLAATSAAGKVFSDDISKLIVEEQERRVRRRRAHALMTLRSSRRRGRRCRRENTRKRR